MASKLAGPPDLFRWGTWDEIERRIRIRLCTWAYAYEIASKPLVSDVVYDALAYQSNTQIVTGKFDDWWKQCYTPYSGVWIHSHPDLEGVRRLYETISKSITRLSRKR